MVEKPTEGKCSECGSENLIFHDDGTGRCPDCGRVFRWSQEPQGTQKPEPRREEIPRQTDNQYNESGQAPVKERTTSQPTSERRNVSATGASVGRVSKSKRNGFHPSNKPKSAERKKEKKGFLYISAVGFILLMVGYGMFYGINAMSGFIEEPIQNMSAFRSLSMMLNYIGIILVGLGLVWGAATADHLDDKVRSWMLAAMAILLGLFLGLGLFTMGMF